MDFMILITGATGQIGNLVTNDLKEIFGRPARNIKTCLENHRSRFEECIDSSVQYILLLLLNIFNT